MTLQEMIQEVETLSLEERKALINVLVESLIESASGKKMRSILEFEGLGAEIWDGIDAQQYINELRDEWDERP